jgi:hypothetical protein
MPNKLIAQILSWVFLVIIFFAVFGYAILYHISLALFPWFVFFYILSAIGILISIFLVWHNWDDEPEPFMVVGLVCIFVFVISMAGASTTANFIQSIPQTQEGKASLQTWNDVWFLVGIPEYVQGELDRALEQQLNNICLQYDENTCASAKSILSTYKGTQELQDWMDKGKTLYDFVESKEGNK